MNAAALAAVTDFSKPSIEYAELWPMLVVFGAACAGVLVEAFLPRQRRYLVQVVLTLAALVAALVGTVPGRHRPRGASAAASPAG